MKSLFELYKPRSKKEKEFRNSTDKKQITNEKGGKTSFEGEPVKTYDREKMGAKAGKDVRGDVCESKKLKRKWPKINDDNEGSDEINEPSDVRS